MKEISKFLLKTIKQNFPKNKNQSSQTISNVPFEFSKGLKHFIKTINKKIIEGEREYNKIKKDIQKNNIIGGNYFDSSASISEASGLHRSKNLPKSSDYHYIPQNIRDNLENSHTQIAKYKFSIHSQEILLHIVYPFSEKQSMQMISPKKIQTFFEACLHKIYLWLFVASFNRQNHCSQQLQINLYLTDKDKVLPEFKKIIEEEDVNTAFTTSCEPSAVINIYREEEWFKVFIHESFHCFGFDFSHDNELTHFSQQEIKKIFPLDIEVLLYETYCEVNADILNVIFITHFNNGNENLVYDLLYWESVFSCFQCIKVLQYHKIKFEQLFQKGIDYKENTNVFCYFILKAIIMMNLCGYFEWFYK